MSSHTTLEKALAILPKFTSMLSFLGSSMIISQVLQSKKNRSNSQQRLVCAMSCVDITVSTVWFLTNFFVPPWSEEVAWASGNQGTCNAQGFIVQLSIGAVYYNATLSLYYLLVIRYSFNRDRISRLEPWMHVVPLSLGVGTAVASSVLNLYNPANWDCWIAPHPPDCHQSYTLWGTGEVSDCERGDNATIYQWAFFFGPLWTAILAISITMGVLYRHVRAQDDRMQRYDFGARRVTANGQPVRRRSSIRTRQVWNQSALYVGAFFVTWIFPTLARLVQLFGGDPPMWLIFLSGTFIPFQGFFNAIVYFRLRFNNLKLEYSDKSNVWLVLFIIRNAFSCCCQEDTDGMDLEDMILDGAPRSRLARLSRSLRESFSSMVSMTSTSMVSMTNTSTPTTRRPSVFSSGPFGAGVNTSLSLTTVGKTAGAEMTHGPEISLGTGQEGNEVCMESMLELDPVFFRNPMSSKISETDEPSNASEAGSSTRSLTFAPSEEPLYFSAQILNPSRIPDPVMKLGAESENENISNEAIPQSIAPSEEPLHVCAPDQKIASNRDEPSNASEVESTTKSLTIEPSEEPLYFSAQILNSSAISNTEITSGAESEIEIISKNEASAATIASSEKPLYVSAPDPEIGSDTDEPSNASDLEFSTKQITSAAMIAPLEEPLYFSAQILNVSRIIDLDIESGSNSSNASEVQSITKHEKLLPQRLIAPSDENAHEDRSLTNWE